MIRRLADSAEACLETSEAERAQVAGAIRRSLFPMSLRQGVLRILLRLGLDGLRNEWERLYGVRSSIFHGTARLSNDEISQVAVECMTLCGRIVLAAIASLGIQVPSIAKTHFE